MGLKQRWGMYKSDAKAASKMVCPLVNGTDLPSMKRELDSFELLLLKSILPILCVKR